MRCGFQGLCAKVHTTLRRTRWAATFLFSEGAAATW
ncbi:hypothetical protein [Paraburkholderia sp. BCC1885]